MWYLFGCACTYNGVYNKRSVFFLFQNFIFPVSLRTHIDSRENSSSSVGGGLSDRFLFARAKRRKKTTKIVIMEWLCARFSCILCWNGNKKDRKKINFIHKMAIFRSFAIHFCSFLHFSLFTSPYYDMQVITFSVLK